MPKIRKVNHRFDRINSLTPVRNHSCVAMPNMRVIYAGSFDPIHSGHCHVLDHLCKQFPNAAIHIIPCAYSPSKPNMTDSRLRVAMIKQAIKNKPRVYLDMSQINRGKVSFLADELSELRSRYGEHTPLILAFSDDVINNLHLWGELWKKLLDYCHLYIWQREGLLSPDSDVRTMITNRQTDSLHSMAENARGSIYIDKWQSPCLSSTEIRDQLRHEHACHGLPDGVESIIRKHGLYGTHLTSVNAKTTKNKIF